MPHYIVCPSWPEIYLTIHAILSISWHLDMNFVLLLKCNMIYRQSPMFDCLMLTGWKCCRRDRGCGPSFGLWRRWRWIKRKARLWSGSKVSRHLNLAGFCWPNPMRACEYWPGQKVKSKFTILSTFCSRQPDYRPNPGRPDYGPEYGPAVRPQPPGPARPEPDRRRPENGNPEMGGNGNFVVVI